MVLGQLAVEAGCTLGLPSLLSDSGETGALMASNIETDNAGSVATARKIVQIAAASNLMSVTLELGAKSPSIIFPGANLDLTV